VNVTVYGPNGPASGTATATLTLERVNSLVALRIAPFLLSCVWGGGSTSYAIAAAAGSIPSDYRPAQNVLGYAVLTNGNLNYNYTTTLTIGADGSFSVVPSYPYGMTGAPYSAPLGGMANLVDYTPLGFRSAVAIAYPL
jgi:hypothetical protein